MEDEIIKLIQIISDIVTIRNDLLAGLTAEEVDKVLVMAEEKLTKYRDEREEEINQANSEGNENYPLGGMVEPYDIERENK